VSVRGGKAAVENDGENYYFVIPLRNVGTGLGVLHAWHLAVLQPRADSGHAEPEEFRPQTLDLYVPAGDTGYWQGAVRGPDDPFSEGRLHLPPRLRRTSTRDWAAAPLSPVWVEDVASGHRHAERAQRVLDADRAGVRREDVREPLVDLWGLVGTTADQDDPLLA
jgi:hypothetical protein